MSIPRALQITAAILILAGLVWGVVNAPFALGLTYGSAILAMAIDRGVQCLGRKGVPRTAGIALLLSIILLLVAGILALAGPILISQIRYFIAFVPQAIDRLQDTPWFERVAREIDLADQLQRLKQQIPTILTRTIDAALGAAFQVLSWILFAVTVFFLTVFMLVFGRKFLQRVLEQLLPQSKKRYQQVLHNIYRSVGGYIFGLGLVVLLNATATTTFLAIMGIPLFLLLGLLSGFSTIIPIAGPTFTALVVSLIALTESGWPKALGVIIFLVIYQQFENQVIGPLIYRKTARINPLALVVGLLFLSELFGFAGAVLSVPTMAILQVLYLEIIHSIKPAVSTDQSN